MNMSTWRPGLKSFCEMPGHFGGESRVVPLFPELCGLTWKSASIWPNQGPSMSSLDTGKRMPICGLNFFGSSRGPVCRPGPSCSRTFVARGRRNSPKTSPCTSSVSGSATPSPSRRSTTCRSLTTTSQKRCEIRCSNPPFCLARGRKAIWLSARKPLFCNWMRRIARRCQRSKLPE